MDTAGDTARELSAATRHSARRRLQLLDHLLRGDDALGAVQL